MKARTGASNNNNSLMYQEQKLQDSQMIADVQATSEQTVDKKHNMGINH